MEETQPLEVMLGNQVSHVVFNIIQCRANPVVLGLHGLSYITPMVIGTYGGFLQNQKRKRKRLFNLLFLELGHLYV
jgi:hypothetical protein